MSESTRVDHHAFHAQPCLLGAVGERAGTAVAADVPEYPTTDAPTATLVTRAEAIEYNSGDLPNFHAHQLRDIIAAVREKRPPAVTGEDGRRVVGIIQGVYESGRTGRPVKLSG